MMKTLERNMRNGQAMLKMFDIGKTFHHASWAKTFIPGIEEREHLCIAISGNATAEQWSAKQRTVDFYDIKGIIEDLCTELQLTSIKFRAPKTESKVFTANSLEIVAKNGTLGIFGEVSLPYRSGFGIDTPVYAAEINLSALYAVKPAARAYKQVGHFPAVKRDVAFVVDAGVTSEQIGKVITQSGGELLVNSSVFDVFEGKSLGEGKKSLAFTMTFQSAERTLVEQEIQQAVSAIISAVEKATGGKLRE